MLIGRVKGQGTKMGTLNIECVQLAGEHLLRDIPPLQSSGVWGLPEPESEVALHREGGSLRWSPQELNSPPTWAATRRRGLADPTGDVVLIVDGQARVARLGTNSANKKVVHEGVYDLALAPIRTAIKEIVTMLATLPVPPPPTVALTTALAQLELWDTTLTPTRPQFETPAVLVPAGAITQGGGGA